MNSANMIYKAKLYVKNYIDSLNDYQYNLTLDDIMIVWFCKTLQNWKALVTTNVNDNLYFELTYNGDKQETYIDVYHKLQNIIMENIDNV